MMAFRIRKKTKEQTIFLRFPYQERRQVGAERVLDLDWAPTTFHQAERCEYENCISDWLSTSVEQNEMNASLKAKQNAFVVGIELFALVAVGSIILFQGETLRYGFLGSHPYVSLLLCAGVIFSEFNPISTRNNREGSFYTAAWSFYGALLLLLPPLTLILTIAIVRLAALRLSGREWIRVGFNTAQGSLVVALAYWILDLFGAAELFWSKSTVLTPMALLGIVLAYVCLVFVNHLIVTSVISIGQGGVDFYELKSELRDSLLPMLSLTAFGLLIVVSLERSFFLLPIIGVVTVSVYTSARSLLRTRREASQDPLTGVFNRKVLMKEIERAIDQGIKKQATRAVLLVDIDGFRQVNERLGHQVGDAALIAIAKRLEATTRQSDLLARIGGDEFVVLLRGITSSEEAVLVANDISRAFDVPLEVKGFPIKLSVSIGIAVYPEHGFTADAILGCADVALHGAKSAKAGPVLYDGVRDRSRSGRLSLLAELNTAIETGQLFLLYQPKIRLATNTVAGVEALIRWRHPRLGIVPPAEFMPAAENTELMIPLTEWVLNEALQQCAIWQSKGIELPVAINGSARNLHDVAFPATVENALKKAGLAASFLEIEITENTVMSDPARSQLVLKDLRSLGVEISVDDFGTGYSSLAHLRDLPISMVKIDSSFVIDMLKELNDALIVRSIIDLAANLGLQTVAEGVETREAMDQLRLLGCDLAQGYFISRPATPETLLAWIRHNGEFHLPVARHGTTHTVAQ